MAGGQQEHFHDWHSDVLAAALACLSVLHLSFASVTGRRPSGVKAGGGVDRTVLHCTLSGKRAAHSNVRLNTV